MARRTLLATLSVCALAACSDKPETPTEDAGTRDALTLDASSPADGADLDTGLADDAGSVDGGTDAGVSSDAQVADEGPRDLGPFMPHATLANLADETALDLGEFECLAVPGEDPDLCKRTTDYGGLVYDPHHHELLMFGGGHSTTMTDALHVFDLSGTLHWSDRYAPTPCDQMNAGNLDGAYGAWLSGAGGPFPRPVSTHTYDMLAVAPRLDEFIVISRNFSGGYCNPVGNDIGGRVAHFERGSQTWTFSPSAEGTGNELSTSLPGSEPDPISGSIVLLSGAGLSLYDPATRVYTHVSDNIATEGYANHLVYFPPDDKFYFFARNDPVDVYALSLDRTNPGLSTVEHLTTTGPSSPHGEPGYDYDAVNHVIGGAVQDNMFYAFDPTTLSWTAHAMNGGTPGSQAFHALAYDPVNNVFLFVTDYDSGQHTWAYRLRR